MRRKSKNRITNARLKSRWKSTSIGSSLRGRRRCSMITNWSKKSKLIIRICNRYRAGMTRYLHKPCSRMQLNLHSSNNLWDSLYSSDNPYKAYTIVIMQGCKTVAPPIKWLTAMSNRWKSVKSKEKNGSKLSKARCKSKSNNVKCKSLDKSKKTSKMNKDSWSNSKRLTNPCKRWIR